MFGKLRALGEVGDSAPPETRGFAGDPNLSGADRREPGEHAEEGGLAGTVGADERGPTSAGDFKGRIVERDRTVDARGGGESLGGDSLARAALLLLGRIRDAGQDGEERLTEPRGEALNKVPHGARSA